VTSENWWAPLIGSAGTDGGDEPIVGQRFEVFASMTTGMAYDLVPHLCCDRIDGALKFVTTGLIDPGVCHWSTKTCRYLKRKYDRPVIRQPEDLPAAIGTRLAKVRRPKILVAGLSTKVEAYLDERGEYCGAVSTFTIVDPEDDVHALARLCDYLNSVAASRLLQLRLGANSMSGGRITLSKDFLRQLPFS
jgi:hypothetical protein